MPPRNIMRDSLHPIMKEMGRETAGFHAFRRFRESILQMSEARTLVIDYWMGHANGEMPSTMWRSNSITDTPSTSRLVIFHATLFPPHREIVPRRLIPEQLGLPTTARTKNVISTADWGARPVPRDRA